MSRNTATLKDTRLARFPLPTPNPPAGGGGRHCGQVPWYLSYLYLWDIILLPFVLLLPIIKVVCVVDLVLLFVRSGIFTISSRSDPEKL